jgi:hypothetical protein
LLGLPGRLTQQSEKKREKSALKRVYVTLISEEKSPCRKLAQLDIGWQQQD